MKHSATPKKQRCAIYTRKSTEHNLDLAFNSLDAQREACEAYIKSQAHEGWTLVPTGFDDGGLSGASLNRPALHTLLDAVRAKKLDIIVVYKVDRLTRSLADFAKLVELFDQHDVSFVSVTQSFNTTSSMGRLTLNVLLSFAQFEREVIGERVRDKIAASKRKGIWVGGPVPLGYRSVNKKLEVVPGEAELVRRIFADYLKLGSISAVAAKLNAAGLKPKPRKLTNGSSVQAECYRVGPLAHLLKNRFYIGEVEYKGEVHPGSQQPIVDRNLFEAVQARIAEGRIERMELRAASPAILAGKLFDDRGHAMSSTHANKAGARYRYYTSQAILQGRKTEAGSVPRVSAPEIEQLVVAALRSTPDIDSAASDRTLIDTMVTRAVVTSKAIRLSLQSDDQDGANAAEIVIPFAGTTVSKKGVARAAQETVGALTDEARTMLLTAIVRSQRWVNAITSGVASSFDDIAASENLAERYVRRLSVLAYVSPKIVAAIDDRSAPDTVTLSNLTQALPFKWADQDALFGL